MEITFRSAGVIEIPPPPGSAASTYMMFAQANTLPQELLEWLAVNPREQNLNSSTSKAILNTLRTKPEEMQNLNKGLFIPASAFHTQGDEVTLVLENPNLHGVGDGGHTLRCILKVAQEGLTDACYVPIDVRCGLEPAQVRSIISARNNTSQVDDKSLMDFNGDFDVLKEIIKGEPFAGRVEYHMNQTKEEEGAGGPINVLYLLSLLLMFDQDRYPLMDIQRIKDINPLPHNSSLTQKTKEIYREMGKEPRERLLWNLKPIAHDIFQLYDEIQYSLPLATKVIGNRFKKNSYTKYNEGKAVGTTYLGGRETAFIIPRSIPYTILSGFRELAMRDENGSYGWSDDPYALWQRIYPEEAKRVAYEKLSPNKLGTAPFIYSSASMLVRLRNHQMKEERAEQAASGATEETEPEEGGMHGSVLQQ